MIIATIVTARVPVIKGRNPNSPWVGLHDEENNKVERLWVSRIGLARKKRMTTKAGTKTPVQTARILMDTREARSRFDRLCFTRSREGGFRFILFWAEETILASFISAVLIPDQFPSF
jgi:hypothetical protein